MDGNHIPISEPDAYFINGINPVNNRRTGAYGNQGVHVGRTVKQRLKSHPVIFRIDKYHRDQKQKLCKSKAHGIFHS